MSLAEELRDAAKRLDHLIGQGEENISNPARRAYAHLMAAATALDLSAEALEPFAYEYGEMDRRDDWKVFGNFTMGDFRRANRVCERFFPAEPDDAQKP